MDTGNERYRRLIETLPEAFSHHQIVTNSEGKPVDYIFLDINPAFEEITGLSRDKIIYKKVTEVLPGIENSNFDWIGTFGRVALTGETLYFEQYSEPLGRYYEVITYAEGDGCFSVIFKDISDRKEKEIEGQELSRSEERYRNLIENLNEVVYILDDRARVSYVSPNIGALASYDASEVIGRPFTDFVHPDDLEGRIEQFQKIISGINEPSEYRMVTKEGREVWVRTNARPVTREGRVVGIQGILTDITSLKQAEEALNAQLGLGNLVADVSTYFATLPVEQLHEGIEKALQMAFEFFQVDRSYIFQFSEEKQTRSLSYEWHGQDIKPLKERLKEQPLAKFSWWKERLESKSCVRIPDVDDLPPEAEREKEEFKAQQLKSLITVPIIKEGKLFGALGFDSIKNKMNWTREHEMLLNVLAELISFAIAKYESREKLRESEEKNRAILSAFPDLMFVFNREGVYLDYHVSDESLLVAEPEYFRNKSVYEVLPKEVADKFVHGFIEVNQSGKTQNIEYSLGTPAGHKHFEARINPLGQDKYISIVRDITGRKQAEADQAASLSILEATLEATADGLLVTSRSGKVTKWNNNFLELWNIPKDLAEEGEDKKLLGHVTDKVAYPEEFIAKVRALYNSPEDKSLDIIELADGRLLERYSQPQWLSEEIIGRVWSFRDITERKKYEAELKYMSFHDQLTGLYNRHYLEEEMKRLNTERQQPISIIMADLNGLKLINDTYGHHIGDEMLKRSAEILKSVCRDEDILARFGGDEFVLYLPKTPYDEAMKISSRIIEACRKVMVNNVPLSLSTGAAIKVSAEQKLLDVLGEAEDSMYRDKLTESRSSKSAIVNSLLQTLTEKSYETEAHTRNMQEAAKRIGENLGLPTSELHRLSLLITLHDIGKINIPEEMLTRKGSLSSAEWKAMKKHSETGYRIAKATDEFAHVAEDILAHHEHWDGSGYPQGLKGEAIPILARITAIADAYEVMINGRPYKKALSKNEIVTKLKNCSGTQFDPELVEIFLSILEEEG